jgi:hypothetical protein
LLSETKTEGSITFPLICLGLENLICAVEVVNQHGKLVVGVFGDAVYLYIVLLPLPHANSHVL